MAVAGTGYTVVATADGSKITHAGWATHISAMPAGVAAGLAGTDGDESGQPLTFTLAPSSGDFSDLFSEAPAIDSSGNLTYKPAANAFGSMAVDVSLSDGADTANDSFTIEITAVNDAPVVSGIPDSTINEDESFVFDLDQYTVDVDNDSSEITYTAQVISGTASNAALAIDDSTHTMSVAAVEDSSGSFTIRVTAMDDSSAVGSDTFQVVVVPVNDAPVIVSPIPDKRIYRNTGLHTLVNSLHNVFVDKEGDLINFEVITESDSFTTVIQNNRLSANLLADQGSVEDVIVTCTDGQLTTADTFKLSFVQWAVRVTATTDSAANIDNFIGVAGPATDGYDPDYEQPAGAEGDLSVYFDRPEWLPDSSASFDQDIQPIMDLADTSHSWEFNVVSSAAEDVTLGFQFYDYPNIPARVLDLESSIPQPLVPATELQYTASPGTPRAFRIQVGDVVAPAAVQDLAVDSSLSRSMILQWTSPGDDGVEGTAVSYDIRYSLMAITSENFSSAMEVTENVPLPAAGGQLQTVAVPDLAPATEYFFALRATDDAGNVSSVSNMIPHTTLPVPLTDLDAYWGKFHNDLLNQKETQTHLKITHLRN